MHTRTRGLSRVPLSTTPWTVALQAPLSTGFSRQGYWSGLPFPIPGDVPDPGIKPVSLESPALARGFFYHCTTWEVPPMLYSGAVALEHLLLQLEGTWPHRTSTHSVEAGGPYTLEGSPSLPTSPLFPASLGIQCLMNQ